MNAIKPKPGLTQPALTQHRVLKKNQTYSVVVDGLSHEGRGVASLDGQRVFIEGALPGEVVVIKLLNRKKKVWQAQTQSIENHSPDRVTPPCEFADICGGCSLQHMSLEKQHELKQNTLRNQLKHFGQCEIDQLEPVLTGADLGYRTKARLGVRYVAKKNKVLVGFREKNAPYLANMNQCEVIDPRVGYKLQALQDLIYEMDARQTIAQIEVAASEQEVGLIFRHLEPLSTGDLKKLSTFCNAHNFLLYLQPAGPASVHLVTDFIADKASQERLQYHIDGLKLSFHPLDFTQVNQSINQQMVARTLAWLDLQAFDNVLDLFCGLGNFTLPIAKRVSQVVGIEGSQAMVERGYENAQANHIQNCKFYAADLFLADSLSKVDFDLTPNFKVLLDPPRSGAEAVVRQLITKPVHLVVYVSCNAATLARDCAILQEGGFKVAKAGMMDMFPHTHHMESIALLTR